MWDEVGGRQEFGVMTMPHQTGKVLSVNRVSFEKRCLRVLRAQALEGFLVPRTVVDDLVDEFLRCIRQARPFHDSLTGKRGSDGEVLRQILSAV